MSSFRTDHAQEAVQQLATDEVMPNAGSKNAGTSHVYLLENEVYVETNDGKKHLSSRRHLAAHSHFFRALFNGQYADSRHDIIQLTSVDSTQFSQCLSLLPAAQRSAMPDISLKQALDLLPTASFLWMESLLRLLSSVVLKRVEVSTVVDAFRTAEYRYPPLADLLWHKLVTRFYAMVETREFLKMNEPEMLRAMDDERLNIAAKEEVNTVSKYIQAHPDSSDRLHRTASTWFARRSEGDKDETPILRNRVPYEVVVAAGGWGIQGPSEIVETFNPRTGLWTETTATGVRCHEPLAYHSLNISDDRVFLCGGMNGREYFQKASTLDLSTGIWSALPPMRERRCYLSAVAHTDSHGASRLMVVGGYNGVARHATCEIFDINGNVWSAGPSMRKARSDGAVVLVGNRVAAIGGFEGENIHQDVELLDVGTDSWYAMPRKLRQARTGTNAVSLDENTLLVAGGFGGGTARLKSAELCDVREGVWHMMAPMTVPRSNFGIEILDGKVMVVGGFEGSRTTAATERYDIRAQRWESLPSLSLPRSAVKLIRLTGHDIIRKLVCFESQPSILS